ncbi:MAG: hypothetical protein VKN60_01070 [Cyanobacteriota bacterium]|nr:hypothetical protein [Cyanobacteriota bacterium]
MQTIELISAKLAAPGLKKSASKSGASSKFPPGFLLFQSGAGQTSG